MEDFFSRVLCSSFRFLWNSFVSFQFILSQNKDTSESRSRGASNNSNRGSKNSSDRSLWRGGSTPYNSSGMKNVRTQYLMQLLIAE